MLFRSRIDLSSVEEIKPKSKLVAVNGVPRRGTGTLIDTMGAYTEPTRLEPKGLDPESSLKTRMDHLVQRLGEFRQQHLAGASDETLLELRAILNEARDTRDQIWSLKKLLG